MSRRLNLQALLENILQSRNVYFQPPESQKIKYPAIIYSLENIDSTFADDGVYFTKRKYSITVIDENPDSSMVDDIAMLPTCRFNRHFKSDNLNHYVYSLYY